MSNKQKFQELMDRYNNVIGELSHLLAKVSSHCIGYDIEDIHKNDEQSAKEFGVQFLKVDHLGPKHKSQIISSLNFVRKERSYSTQFVSRYPGIIVVEQQSSTIKQLVEHINELKVQLADTVRYFNLVVQDTNKSTARQARDKHQKHKFIHDLEPGIMTEQLYRNIQIIEEPVTHCWFNWTQRPVSVNLKGQKAVKWLDSLRDKPRSGFTKDQWQMRLDEITLQLKNYDFIQHYRLLRHIPICTYQTVQNNTLKRHTKNANTPFILLGQDRGQLPKFSHLKNWDVNARKRRMRAVPGLEKTTLLDEPHILGVVDNRSPLA